MCLTAVLCGCASRPTSELHTTTGSTKLGARPLSGLDAAAAIVFGAATSDESALPALRGAASTAAELQALCPAMVIPDQVEPSLVMRYIETQCPDLTGDCLAPVADGNLTRGLFTFTPMDPAWWGGQACPGVKVWKVGRKTPLMCTTLYGCYADQKAADLHEATCEACQEQAQPDDEDADRDTDDAVPCADECGACGWGETATHFMDDVFVVQHAGGTNIVWSFKGFDAAMITREPMSIVSGPADPRRSLMSYDDSTEREVEVFFCGAHATSGI